MLGEYLPQPGEARVALEVGADVPQRSWHVLDVDRVSARQRLIAERPECLEVALHRHQVESAAECVDVRPRYRRFARLGRPGWRVVRCEEACDQLLDLRLGEIDVGVAQQ